MTALGQRVRPDGWEERTSGTAVYTTDVTLPGMLEARILRSPHPHADIRSIDTAQAEAHSGVVAVLTADDLPDRTYLHLGDPFRDRFALASDRVRFVGEEVAAVAAHTRADADAALGLIDVSYKPRDAVLNASVARASGAATVHDGAIGNLALQTVRPYGDPESARSDADGAQPCSTTRLCAKRKPSIASGSPIRHSVPSSLRTSPPACQIQSIQAPRPPPTTRARPRSSRSVNAMACSRYSSQVKPCG